MAQNSQTRQLQALFRYTHTLRVFLYLLRPCSDKDIGQNIYSMGLSQNVTGLSLVFTRNGSHVTKRITFCTTVYKSRNFLIWPFSIMYVHSTFHRKEGLKCMGVEGVGFRHIQRNTLLHFARANISSYDQVGLLLHIYNPEH